MVDERRKDPRFPLRLETEVKFTSWHVFSLLYTINISKGGMNLEVADEPPVGAALTIKMTLPKGDPLVLQAVVKHAQQTKKGWSVGVQFVDLDNDKRQAIERTIRANGGMLSAPGLTPRSK